MKKSLKRSLISFISLLFILIIAAMIYYFSPPADDYGTFLNMREFQIKELAGYSNSEREINQTFENYTLSLPPLYAFMFKDNNLSLFLKSYEGERIETATINQLEIGRNTGNFFDFTFMIRPRPEYNVPFFHGDALKALPGVTSALYMDFYSLNSSVDLAAFFGKRAEQLQKAVKLAEPYWKHEGFGELTPHLDPYKSPWRLEMIEPERGTEKEKQEYFKTVYTCFTLYMKAYMESLYLAERPGNPELTKENRAEIEQFVSILYKEDIAVKMGKMIFPPEDFDTYFLNGFWGITP